MKVILLILAFTLPTLAFAKPDELKKYKATFPDKAAEANCKTCHTKGKELNDFGKAYKEAGKDFSKMKKE